jgi:glycosyltransferase involved in cell wall biosynthesis|tara:strand:+ start:1205 stop:2062 length:858 start_codon:yes stop_codon:yes gene_type:complete
MRISAIIPSYNRLESLKRAINSVLNQDCAVDELIVVDDGSTDNTATYIQQNLPQIKLIQQTNQGVSAARNAGIKRASCDWIALLDSDDSWHYNKISTIKEHHVKQPDIELIHSDEIWIRNHVRVNAMNKHQKTGGHVFLRCLPLCVISPSAVVLKRSLIESVGYFDESLPACEDYDLWLKICCHHSVHYIDLPLITKYGGHEDQLSTQHWGMDRFRIRALSRLIQRDQLSDTYRLAANEMLQKKLKVLLNGAKKHNNQSVLDEFSVMISPLIDQVPNNQRAKTTC